MRIPINKDWYCLNETFYLYDKLDLEPGITSLVGCNGSGKSTILHQISEFADKNNIPCYAYDDRQDGHSRLMEKFAMQSELDKVAMMMCSSEGEKNMIGVSECALNVGRAIRQCKRDGNKELFILLDSTDSGMSVDAIEELRDVILTLIIPDAQSCGIDPYFVIASNNYEWINDSSIHSIDVVTGKPLLKSTYSVWKRCINHTRKYKDKRNHDTKN